MKYNFNITTFEQTISIKSSVMKKQLLVSTALSLSMLLINKTTLAQGDAAVLLKAGTQNANSLFNGYLGPLMKGMSQSLNNGWYNTAKPHGTGGFDITFTMSAFQVPDADKTFDIASAVPITPTPGQTLYLQSTNPLVPIDPNTSTMFGADKSNKVVIMANTLGGIPIDTMELPKGTNVGFGPGLPQLQLGIGIYKNTELMIRYIPSIKLGSDGKVGGFGFGVKHDIKQWIPVIKEQKIWDWSALFSYNSIGLEYDLGSELKPRSDLPNNTGSSFDNQKLILEGSGWQLGTIVSAKLLFFTPYLGLGYASSTMKLKAEGDYPVTLPNPITQQSEITNAKDPVNIENSTSGFRATAGFRIKLLLLTIHADYTFAEYNAATIGVGLNLQSIVPFKL